MAQSLTIPRPQPSSQSTHALTIASCDVIWQVNLRTTTVLGLRIDLRRTHGGITQTILSLGPEATQAIAVSASAGEILYGTTDVLRLPAGDATLFGNVSLSGWREDAKYNLTAARWRQSPDGWRQDGPYVEWLLPSFEKLQPGTVHAVAPRTPFATLRIVLL